MNEQVHFFMVCHLKLDDWGKGSVRGRSKTTWTRSGGQVVKKCQFVHVQETENKLKQVYESPMSGLSKKFLWISWSNLLKTRQDKTSSSPWAPISSFASSLRFLILSPSLFSKYLQIVHTILSPLTYYVACATFQSNPTPPC